MFETLLKDDNIAISLYFTKLLKKDENNIFLTQLQNLLDDDNLIRTINSSKFWHRYKKITELLIYSKLENVFDTMTDSITSSKKIDQFEYFIELYINLSIKLGIELGVMVGKLKLAMSFKEIGDIEKSKSLVQELLQAGFQSDEFDKLVSDLNIT